MSERGRRKSTNGRGGARPRAGRPREVQDPVRLAVDFERVDAEALADLARKRRESVAALLRRIVHGYLKRIGRI